MPPLYRIRDWGRHFENNRTRELKRIAWVPMPNKHDGDGYTELVSHPDGAAHYGAWCALVAVASKCDPRGTLLRDGAVPHDTVSLARKTRLPAAIFAVAIPRLLAIGWLEQVTKNGKVIEISQEGAKIPRGGAERSQESALKGREGKGKEEEKAAADAGTLKKENPTAILHDALPLSAWNTAARVGINTSHVLKYLKKCDPEFVYACLKAAIRKGEDPPALFDSLCRRDVKVQDKSPSEIDIAAAKEELRLHRAKQAQEATRRLGKDRNVGTVGEALGGKP